MHMRAQTNLSVAVHAPVLALLRRAAEEWPIACDSASSRDVGGVPREVAESLQRHTAVEARAVPSAAARRGTARRDEACAHTATHVRARTVWGKGCAAAWMQAR